MAAYEAGAGALSRPHKNMQGLFLAAVSQAFDRASEALVREHAALLVTEQDNARVLNHRQAACCMHCMAWFEHAVLCQSPGPLGLTGKPFFLPGVMPNRM